tara:strand:- start:385 stop:1011 length:627 start_codon:yes stop_codon:yes gene_type:complete
MRASLLLLLFCYVCNQSFSQGAADDNANRTIKNPNDLGRQFYRAIKNNRYEQAKNASALTLTQTDMKNIGHDLIKMIERKIEDGVYKDPADGHAMIGGIRSAFLNEEEIKKQFAKSEQVEKIFKKSFFDIQASAKKHGFNWGQTKHLKTDSSRVKSDRHVPLPMGDIYIHFMADNREFRIKLPNCANPPKIGWLMDPAPLSLEIVKTK